MIIYMQYAGKTLAKAKKKNLSQNADLCFILSTHAASDRSQMGTFISSTKVLLLIFGKNTIHYLIFFLLRSGRSVQHHRAKSN